MRINRNAKCESCRRGENDEPADYYVTGTMNGRPYRGYLCNDHLSQMEEDGLKVKQCISLK